MDPWYGHGSVEQTRQEVAIRSPCEDSALRVTRLALFGPAKMRTYQRMALKVVSFPAVHGCLEEREMRLNTFSRVCHTMPPLCDRHDRPSRTRVSL